MVSFNVVIITSGGEVAEEQRSHVSNFVHEIVDLLLAPTIKDIKSVIHQ